MDVGRDFYDRIAGKRGGGGRRRSGTEYSIPIERDVAVEGHVSPKSCKKFCWTLSRVLCFPRRMHYYNIYLIDKAIYHFP
jgi:hypothetical protein